MWIDFCETIFTQSKCDNDIYSFLDPHIEYWLGYKILSITPTIFLCSYISLSLTYRAVYMTRKLLKENQINRFFYCEDDDSENIYSHSDILYVLKLFQKDSMSEKNNIKAFTQVFRRITNIKYKEYSSDTIEQNHKAMPSIKTCIYNCQDSFRFTSRFINLHVVALLTLYHLSCLLLFTLLMILAYIGDFNDSINKLLEYFNIDYNFDIPFPIRSIILAPFFSSLLICVVQIFIGVYHTKKHLLEVYKGKCVYLPPVKTLSNSSIASSSFHYGGYLTGFLIWLVNKNEFEIFILILLNIYI